VAESVHVCFVVLGLSPTLLSGVETNCKNLRENSLRWLTGIDTGPLKYKTQHPVLPSSYTTASGLIKKEIFNAIVLTQLTVVQADFPYMICHIDVYLRNSYQLPKEVCDSLQNWLVIYGLYRDPLSLSNSCICINVRAWSSFFNVSVTFPQGWKCRFIKMFGDRWPLLGRW
jgi:hypothetical protein